MKNLFYQCVEGDVLKIYEFLKEVENKTGEQVELENKYYNRFFKDDPDYKICNEDP